MKQNCTHNPSTSQVSKSYHPNPVTFPYPPDPGEHVLETSSAPTTLVETDELDLSSLTPPKGEMESSFSWTCPFKSPTSSTLCFGEPTLGKLNQETDFYMTKHMPKPSSEANRVSVSHSSLVTKNGEHFYGENFIHDFPKSWKHIKEVDWGDKLKLNYTTYGYMLMEIDWGGKFNYTSCGHPMANWQGHETHPTGHKTSEVDWGGHDPNGSDNPPPMSIINLDDLLGRTFLLPMDENGERKRATISEHVKDLCQQQVSREDQLRFKLKIDGDQLDDLISYNQLMEYLEDKTDTGPLEDRLYRFKCIKDHKGPYTSSDPEYNVSSYNLLIEWEPGEQTWEPLSNIIASDPYTCAVYAKEHNLLNTPGWKLLKRHARTARRLIRTLKKSKYRQTRASRKYKHGWEVPRDYAHALQLDIHNGNNKWKEAIDLEIEQIKEYQVFEDFGKAVYDKNTITNAPKGHQKIRVHFVFDVKHCGKFKARLVADGHLTKEPMETVYSGVVSIRNLRLAMFLAELNNLELWGADVGNAYLQALTREKLYIVGGPESEELQGHVLVMYKALYGTRSGGSCWLDKFFDILHQMGFKPSRADPDIWMKSSKDGSHFEYIAVYVDNLAICMEDPKSFCDTLKEKYKLKLKGVGPINYHLGCGYTRDEDGTLVADPRKYVEKILESYEKTFGEKPKKTKTPLVRGDHPESDISDFCDQDQIKQYQTIVGQLIWLSGLGRFDIAVHVMTMSRFRQQPRIGHLERLKKIVGYLANFPHGALRFRLHEPDYSNLPHKEYDWQRTVYGGAKEEIPHDIPEPKGKHVTTTTYVDANLHHDQVTGKAVTACLHIVNATPSHWYTKRQATVETATYGSEFVATRIATDQIIDLRYTIMYLGVPVRSKSYMFGDNKSVVDSASIPTSTLSKKSTLASYHRVREAIAAGYLQFNWKDGKSNPADILSKNWEFANIWPLLKPLLFWKGDTDELNAKTKGSDRIPTKKSLV